MSNPTISFTVISIHKLTVPLIWDESEEMDKKHQTRSLNFYNVYDKNLKKNKTNLNTVERMKNVWDKNHQTSKIKNTGFVIMA